MTDRLNVKRYTIDFSDGETAEGVLYADHAAEEARLLARVAELTQLHADACFDRNLAQTERDSLRAQLEAAKSQIEAWAFRCKEFEAQLEAAKLRLGYYAEGHDLAAPAPTREDGVRGFTFEDAMRIVRGAIDVYGGGYSGEERKAFTAGIQTAFNCLENARPNDTQTAANLRIGSQALAAPAPAPVCEVCGHDESAPAHHLTPSQKGPPWYPAWDHPFTPATKEQTP